MDYTLERNTYIHNKKSLAETEIGDAKQDNFYPQVKIKRWDNESNASFRLAADTNNATVKYEDDKIKWQNGKVEAHFYNIPELEDCEDGGYEFEVILKEKPVSNIIDFTII